MAGWKPQALYYIVSKPLFHEFIVYFKFILLNFLKIHLLIVIEESTYLFSVSHFFSNAFGCILLSLFIVS